MADIAISAPLSSVTPGDTADNTLVFGSFGQPIWLTIFIEVVAGTFTINVNDVASNGITVAAGAKCPAFKIRDGVDVIHMAAASGSDSFNIGVA